MTSSVVCVLSWLCFSAIFIPSANGQGNGAVRLYRNGATSISYTSGIVEVYYDGYWGNICYDSSFGSTEATVICQQLAYTGASDYSYSGIDSSYGTDSRVFVLDDVYCSTSSYLTILQCSYSSYIDSGCSANYDDVTVSCYTTRIWDNPYTGQIRLNGSSVINRGVIEVYCNDQWGTICDDGFNSDAADTVCIQLGYNDYVTYDSEIYQGYSDQPIWLTQVYCSYDYSCLSSCASCPSSEVTNCGHSEDVDITCEYDESSIDYGSTLNTCDYSDLVGLIVGIVVTVFVVTIALAVGIPICICCCLGVGIGAAFRSSNRRTTVTTATTGTAAAVSSTVATQQGYGPPQVHTTTAYYPPAPAGYPAAGYPAQPQPGYENKPPPYPDQEGQAGYPMQQYPPTSY